MSKTIKIYAEVPEDWVESQRARNLDTFLRHSKEMIVNEAIKKMIDKIVAHTKLPKIKIDRKQLKRLVMEKMAERIIDRDTGEV